MPIRLSQLRSTRGVSLIVSTGLMLITLLLAAAAMRLVLGFTHSASRAQQANTAFFAAEGGVEQALYEISARKDGYEFDPTAIVCGNADPSQTTAFSGGCTATNRHRFLSFLGTGLSRGRDFWQLFGKSLKAQSNDYIIPNPYFIGDKDGFLRQNNSENVNEWGVLNKNRPLALALQSDNGDSSFTKLSDSVDGKVILMIDPNDDDFDITDGTSSSEPLVTWIFSAVDSSNVEHTLQGVIRENDFVACGANGLSGTSEHCFELPLNDDAALGDALAGQDINRNISSGGTTTGLNRVSGISETYEWNNSADFMTDFNDPSLDWHDGRLSISLIGTPAETSGALSNTLRYKIESDEVLPDEYTYIISEGFAGPVKQTIETRFRRQTTLPIFSYVIFQ